MVPPDQRHIDPPPPMHAAMKCSCGVPYGKYIWGFSALIARCSLPSAIPMAFRATPLQSTLDNDATSPTTPTNEPESGQHPRRVTMVFRQLSLGGDFILVEDPGDKTASYNPCHFRLIDHSQCDLSRRSGDVIKVVVLEFQAPQRNPQEMTACQKENLIQDITHGIMRYSAIPSLASDNAYAPETDSSPLSVAATIDPQSAATSISSPNPHNSLSLDPPSWSDSGCLSGTIITTFLLDILRRRRSQVCRNLSPRRLIWPWGDHHASDGSGPGFFSLQPTCSHCSTSITTCSLGLA
ncbi:hypothetical protein C8Q70DRAFT_419186 [Cubamyces menziesii]|nr:hypothetical protein C8Q70DRAFT_419186 [Cubamyces menziesii]